MAISIFTTILNWSSTSTYKKYDRVKYGRYVYYALLDHSNDGNPPSTNYVNWGGIMVDPFGTTLTESSDKNRPNFFFSPSYGATTIVEPKILSMRFGDGYEQRIQDGVNNTLLKIDLSFDLRGSAEAAAIVHFLTARAGVESFLFTPPEPYATLRNFLCRSWNHTAIFYENNSIKTAFEQVPY